METRNTFNAHREAFVVDDLHAEEIIEALTIPDGASDRGFDYIEFEPLYFFDAVAQLTASREASACFMVDLFSRFCGLEYGQAVAVGRHINACDWYFFEGCNDSDLDREDLAKFCDFYLFECPEDIYSPDAWTRHSEGSVTAYRLKLL